MGELSGVLTLCGWSDFNLFMCVSVCVSLFLCVCVCVCVSILTYGGIMQYNTFEFPIKFLDMDHEMLQNMTNYKSE